MFFGYEGQITADGVTKRKSDMPPLATILEGGDILSNQPAPRGPPYAQFDIVEIVDTSLWYGG